MSPLRRWFPLAFGFLALVPAVFGQELLPADRPIHEVVDYYVEHRLNDEGVTPAPQIGDANFIRRAMLDLAGRIPTADEARAFVASKDQDKHTQLIDSLLASPDFVRHQRNEFEALLAYEGTSDRAFREYLLKAFQENRRWDRLFRELVATADEGKSAPPEMTFLKDRARDIDRLTSDVSSLFFGVNISCAQCHDHPLVSDWKQDHFFGMKSFFAATFLSKAKRLGEHDETEVKFKTTRGESKTARLMFLTGTAIDEPAPLSDKEKADVKKRLQEADRKKLPPPAPRFSRREALVELALRSGENEFFARSIVNRLWYRLFGHGLVNPVDQMHSENMPTHPELLAWLARDLIAHGYDLKRLLRGLVTSRVYARSSRWTGSEPPSPDLFAVATVRPLTPRQFSLSLLLASTAPGTIKTTLTGAKREDWDKRLEQLENQAAGFASQIEAPSGDFQVSVTEALLFSNSDRIRNDYLRDSGDKLIGRLKSIKDHREAIKTAAWNVLNRPVEDEEAKAFTEYLARRRDRQVEAYKQMVWALFTGSEFRFNY